MSPFRHRIRVRWHECDPQGIVFNANFVTYADIAVTELYREAFGSWQGAMEEHGVDVLTAAASVRFLAPVHFDEEVDLVARLTRVGETSTTTVVVVERGGEPVAEIEVRHVFVDPAERIKVAIPQAMRDVLQGYA